MAARPVGVIGLGSMGMGAARSLLRAGFATHACDVRRDVLDAFAAAGGSPCATPAELGGEGRGRRRLRRQRRADRAPCCSARTARRQRWRPAAS